MTTFSKEAQYLADEYTRLLSNDSQNRLASIYLAHASRLIKEERPHEADLALAEAARILGVDLDGVVRR